MFLRFSFLKTSKRTTATVSKITSREEESGDYGTVSTVYDSVLDFNTEDGTPVRFTHTISGPSLSNGDRVIVRYSPASVALPYAPRNTAEVQSIPVEIAVWFAMLLAVIVGLALLYVALHMAIAGVGR
jgi:hypothetical protein